MTTTRETVDAKAHRLQANVRWLTPAVAQVQGDHALYVVDRLNGDWRCNCPWGAHRTAGTKHCSHVLAAALVAPLAEQRPAPAERPVEPPAAPVAAPVRVIAEQATGDCHCSNVARADLYWNAAQATCIHRLCGRAWTGKKQPVRITPAPAAQVI